MFSVQGTWRIWTFLLHLLQRFVLSIYEVCCVHLCRAPYRTRTGKPSPWQGDILPIELMAHNWRLFSSRPSYENRRTWTHVLFIVDHPGFETDPCAFVLAVSIFLRLTKNFIPWLSHRTRRLWSPNKMWRTTYTLTLRTVNFTDAWPSDLYKHLTSGSSSSQRREC